MLNPCLLNRSFALPGVALALVAMACLCGPGGAQAPETAQTGLPTALMQINGKPYTVEVAATPAQAEAGLMYRTSLPATHGMLFLFSPPHPVNFWMKNTKIPLDMLFVAAGRVVNIVHQAPPCLKDPCAIYGSRVVVDQVVELPAGTARKQGIRKGDSVRLAAAEGSPFRNVLPVQK